MACHILYGWPYCNDAKEGVGAITSPKLNRGWWNSAMTKYFEGNVVCKNLGAIGSGAAEGRRKTSLRDPKKLDFFLSQPRTISPTSRRPIFTKFSPEHVDRCPAKSFRSRILKFFRSGVVYPQELAKMAFLGTLTRRGLQPRGYISGRLRSFSQLAEMPGMCLLLLRF